MIPSGEFSVWVKTGEQLHSILIALEGEGIKWWSRDKATQYTPPVPLPFRLDIRRWRASDDLSFERRLGWNPSLGDFASTYSAEDLIKDETPVNYSSVFDSMVF